MGHLMGLPQLGLCIGVMLLSSCSPATSNPKNYDRPQYRTDALFTPPTEYRCGRLGTKTYAFPRPSVFGDIDYVAHKGGGCGEAGVLGDVDDVAIIYQIHPLAAIETWDSWTAFNRSAEGPPQVHVKNWTLVGYQGLNGSHAVLPKTVFGNMSRTYAWKCSQAPTNIFSMLGQFCETKDAGKQGLVEIPDYLFQSRDQNVYVFCYHLASTQPVSRKCDIKFVNYSSNYIAETNLPLDSSANMIGIIETIQSQLDKFRTHGGE